MCRTRDGVVCPRCPIVVHVDKRFSPTRVGRVGKVDVIIVIDNHVNVPTVSVATIVDFH